jgi:hypothetical protein
VVIYLGKDCRLELSNQLKAKADRILGDGATQFF